MTDGVNDNKSKDKFEQKEWSKLIESTSVSIVIFCLPDLNLLSSPVMNLGVQ